MMRWLLLWGFFFCFSVGSAVLGLANISALDAGVWPRFAAPDPHIPLHEVCFLCSHNAFCSEAHGYLWFQQRLSMVDQLEQYGVRGLMLDIWPWSALVNAGYIVLSHNRPFLNNLFLRERGLRRVGALRLQDELIKIKKDFLDMHPDEVIFIFFEDHVADGPWLDLTLEAAHYSDVILKPDEWDPVKQSGWPTRAWMNARGKQVILFTDALLTQRKISRYVYSDTWRYVVENAYGTLRKEKAARQRSESCRYTNTSRYLYLFNWFAKFSSLARLLHSYNCINGAQLVNAVQYVLAKGDQGVNRFPNFIGLDEVEASPKTMQLINHINRTASAGSREQRSIYWRPMCKAAGLPCSGGC